MICFFLLFCSLLELIHEGELKKMKDYWSLPVRQCPVEDTNFEIGIKNIGQVFGLILIGLVLVGVVSVFEYCRNRKSRIETQKIEKRDRNRTELLSQ